MNKIIYMALLMGLISTAGAQTPPAPPSQIDNTTLNQLLNQLPSIYSYFTTYLNSSNTPIAKAVATCGQSSLPPGLMLVCPTFHQEYIMGEVTIEAVPVESFVINLVNSLGTNPPGLGTQTLNQLYTICGRHSPPAYCSNVSTLTDLNTAISAVNTAFSWANCVNAGGTGSSYPSSVEKAAPKGAVPNMMGKTSPKSPVQTKK